ncbi:MAG: RagB/SusD family nutrient uptake outer membrane protein [Bacteroidales bacterium]
MKRRYILISALFITLFSCTKLDETVYDKIPGSLYPENANQIANLSVNAYKQMINMADDGGWWFLAQEISSDELCGPTRGADWDDGGKWRNMYKHTWSNDDEGVNRMWSLFWSGITTCNQVLDMMHELPQNPALLAKMKEVEVLRAFYYYLLIDNYGDVPYLTSAKNAPSLPLRVKRGVVYDSIVNTVKSALPFLKAGDHKYMATKYMGFALLTKLYLNEAVYKGQDLTGTPEQWNNSMKYCDSLLASPYSLESDVSAPFITANETSREIIFSIPYDENNFQGFRLHMRTLHYQHNLKYDMTVGPWNGFAVVPTFFDTYEQTDKRRDAYFIFGLQHASSTNGGGIISDGLTHKNLDIDPYLPALYMQAANFTPTQIRTTGARVGKYEIKMGAKENLSNDLPLFRITDFYLIKAELMVRLGGNGDQWVNPIRTRAGVATWSGATLEQILAERGRELYAEGHRRQDLIRFDKFKDARWEKQADEVYNGLSRNTFPIPKWATDANPNLLLIP